MQWFWRTLGLFFGLVVIVLIGLLLAGQRSSAGQVSDSIEISRPPAQVWLFLTDDVRIKQWIGGLKGLVHMDSGELGVNKRLALGVEYDGSMIDTMMTITKFSPPNELDFEMISVGEPDSGFTEIGKYRLTPVQNGASTDFAVSTKTLYHGFVLTVMEPFETHTSRAKVKEDLERLKIVAEAEPAAK
jgi:uncharacterized protein YndB with AHSA1/START domain